MHTDKELTRTGSQGSGLHARSQAAERDYLESLMTEREAADFLGFAVRTLQAWRIRGGGPRFVRHRTRAVRYRRKDLIAWSEERIVQSTSEPLRMGTFS